MRDVVAFLQHSGDTLRNLYCIRAFVGVVFIFPISHQNKT
jgi:hypothetical protein